MSGIYMFDITILSIREIKTTKFRSRAIFREFKSLESSGYSNIRPSDIQISEYVRNSELHLRNPVAIPLDTRSGILVLRYDSAGIHETARGVRERGGTERCRLYFYFICTTAARNSAPLFARAAYPL